MQIVIDIPEEEWIRWIVDGEIDAIVLRDSLIKGTPLPKGHGRIGDLSKIYVELNETQIEGTEGYKGLGEAKQIVCDAQTIIEADKGK